MTSEAIVKQVESQNNSDKTLNIHFKQRNTIKGLFIKGNDYKDLKSKNLWRIVTNANIEQWKKTKDMNLARIFNGIEFTRLSDDN
ncbi:MAG: short-chain dehydrogenase [Chitinophagales bacterium]